MPQLDVPICQAQYQPPKSGLPASSSASMAAISRWHLSIHGSPALRSGVISSKVRPSPSSVASCRSTTASALRSRRRIWDPAPCRSKRVRLVPLLLTWCRCRGTDHKPARRAGGGSGSGAASIPMGFCVGWSYLSFFRAAHDELGRGRVPNRRVLSGLPVPGGVLLAHKPAGLMGKPVERLVRTVRPLFQK